MTNKIEELMRRLNRIVDLGHASAILEWDQETYIPDGAHESRAKQISTLRTIAHEEATSGGLGELLSDLSNNLAGAVVDDKRAEALVRVAIRDFEKATKLSTRLVADLATSEAMGKDAWRRARENDDYAAFAPHLEKLIELNIEKAEALGYTNRPYDALLDQFEEGLLTSTVESVFSDLRDELVPIVKLIADSARSHSAPSEDLIRHFFDPQKQWDLSLGVAQLMGYDFDRGRLDKSAHPFSTAFSIHDVRITSRIESDFFSPAFYGTLHEVGHALYEQGIDPSYERTPLADGTSLGIHESQSRLWENLVGRSESFVKFYFDTIQSAFPSALGDATARDFYRAVNTVRPSLIRVEADEVTYNLHIMIRFELECDLISGKLSVADLPEAWNALYKSYLGVTPDCNANGVLQDIHWSMGAFGYFPTYTLGNILSCQFYDQADADLGGIGPMVLAGEFAPLLSWLREHIHQHGRSQTASQITEDITGGSISAKNWLAYIRRKYGALYNCDLS